MKKIDFFKFLEEKYYMDIFNFVYISRDYIINYNRNDYEIFNELEYMIGFWQRLLIL